MALGFAAAAAEHSPLVKIATSNMFSLDKQSILDEQKRLEKNFLEQMDAVLRKFTEKMPFLKNIGINWGRSFNEGLQSQLGNLKIEVHAASGGIRGLVNPPMMMYSSGGLPARGDIFIANDPEPELIGTIGGRPAVVNNAQIVEALAKGIEPAVYSAVYAAMKAAGGGSGGDVAVEVHIGDDVISNAVRRDEARRRTRSGRTVVTF